MLKKILSRANFIISYHLVIILAAGCAAAQDNTARLTAGNQVVTATTTIDYLRIASSSTIVQMHLEVYGSTGERVFDNEIRRGNVFDWHFQNGQAERLAAGDYLCVVTVKNIAGKLTQKIGVVKVGEKGVVVGPAESAQLTLPQSQVIGPIEENSSWTILSPDDNQTTTLIAHNGTDGQIVRGRGALSFRLGDFFSGNDREQMRLTEEGSLGIGTKKPQAKLDVRGDIRASGFLRATKGIEFADGTVQTVGLSGRKDKAGKHRS